MRSGQNKKVIVAMSGGVDSSVSAVLLKKAGFDVVGIFMKFWKEGKSGQNRCCSVESEKLARLVAKQINIPFYVINVEKEFKKKVVDYFLREYKKGNTPNPCVVCNKEIKFGLLINKALKMGADFIATGHYARIASCHSGLDPESRVRAHTLDSHFRPPRLVEAGGNDNVFSLFKGKDKEKDQSYFLWQINQKKIKHILFPVGEYKKLEVRALAKKFNLPTAETPESQEVCFIQNTTNDFLKKYLKLKPGNIIDVNGKILGKHQGLWFYTIGQRKGIEVSQGPYYVVNKDFKKNNLIISKNEKDLKSKEFVASNVNWFLPQKFPINAKVKIRYRSDFAKARIFEHGKSKVKVIFAKPQKAITPGQSAVFYLGSELLGGGVIE